MAANAKNSLPPGPKGVFVFGNTFDINPDKLHLSFTEISEEFGDVFSLRTPGKQIVVVNSYEAFSELYLTDTYGDLLSGREKNFCSTYVANDTDLPQSSNSQSYRKRRSVLANSTNVFARNHEKVQLEELEKFLKHIGEKGETPQDLARPIQLYLTGICLTALTGEAYGYDDIRLVKMVERVDVFQSLILPRVNGLLSACPILRFSPFGSGAAYRRTLKLEKELQALIFDPLKTSYKDGAVRGGIDYLLKARQEANPDEQKLLTDEVLWSSASSTIGAGTGVFVGYLLYYIVVVLHHPEIFEKIRKEVDAVVGGDKLPTSGQISSMPYTEAAVLELFRWVTPAPVLVPRRVEEDIHFREYAIPKDTTLVTNVWKIHHNEAVWSEPWSFKPERFLDEGGKVNQKLKEMVIPFGGGKRKCIGVELSTKTAFIFIAAVAQKYDFKAVELPTLDPHQSTDSCAGVKPKPFSVIVKKRET